MLLAYAEAQNKLYCTFLVVSEKYTCRLKYPSLRDANATTVFEGFHVPGKTDADVTRIQYQYPMFTHIPMEMFEAFPNLIEVSIYAGRFDRIDKFVNCENLKTLFFTSSALEHFPEDLLENCVNLDYLSMGGNQFTKFLIDRPTSLTYLEFGFNRGLTKFHVNKLTNLNRLDMRYNGIDSISSTDFEGLSKLTFLDLGNNIIDTLADGAFSSLTNLEVFWFDQNRMDKLSADMFQNNSKLKTILLTANSIRFIEDGVFNHLSELEFLNLENNVCISKRFEIEPPNNVTSILPDLRRCLPTN